MLVINIIFNMLDWFDRLPEYISKFLEDISEYKGPPRDWDSSDTTYDDIP